MPTRVAGWNGGWLARAVSDVCHAFKRESHGRCRDQATKPAECYCNIGCLASFVQRGLHWLFGILSHRTRSNTGAGVEIWCSFGAGGLTYSHYTMHTRAHVAHIAERIYR